MFTKFLTDDSGATAIEYGILAALMAVVVVAAVGMLDLQGLFGDIQKSLDGAKKHVWLNKNVPRLVTVSRGL